MSIKAKKILNSTGKHFLIYFALFLALFPILWMFLSSFQANQSIINANRGLFDFVPTLENYRNVIDKYDFLKYSWNSFVVAILATIFSLIIGLPCAYVVARYKMRKAWWGKGVGRRMMNLLQDRAKENGLCCTRLRSF